MLRICLGLAVLLTFAVAVGVSTHWTVGAAAVVAPVAVVYLRLKVSSAYRDKCDQRLAASPLVGSKV